MINSRWHPIASSSDLPFRHVYHGQLQGREFAVWRADDGYVNIGENRCLHRGVRLSIGINDGRELKCQYHGWRYSNRTAGCTYIPAHPADAPARTITNRTFPVEERYGFVWSSLEPDGSVPAVPGFAEGNLLVLRAIPVNAPVAMVLDHLKTYRFQPSDDIAGEEATVSVEARADFSIALKSRSGAGETLAVFFVQPVDAARSVIRGVLDRDVTGAAGLAVLRHHNERLSALRDRVEAKAARAPALPAIEPVFEQVPPELAEMPALAPAGRRAAISVEVARKWQAAEGIAGFELRAVSGLLPTFQPGAHVD
ncbi:Rieske 2Fe-2S domain-containing protein, partial [Rhizobiaceae sp. 2RAB30]